MPFIYITGSAGSGKTTIQQALIKQGYKAYDEDDPEIGSAFNKAANQPVSVPPVEQRSQEWFSQHEWRVYPEALKRLKTAAQTEIMFLCGNVATEQQLIEDFDEVLFLNITENIMRKRLSERTDNDFGKTEAEVQMIMKRDAKMRALHSQLKSHMIDAEQPLEQVLLEIKSIVTT